MATGSIQTFSRFSQLSPALELLVLSYTPVTALASVSKAFRGLQEKLMQQIWIGMKGNPLLAERVRALSAAEFSTLCFQALLNQQRKLAERTPAGFNAFQKLQLLEAGSYSQTRFIQAEPIIPDVDREQDDNLWKVWIATRRFRAILGDTPPQNAAEIRTWMNVPENQVHLDNLETLHLRELRLTAFPEELAKCRYIKNIWADKNYIRELPDWFKKFSRLEKICINENLFDHVPEVLVHFRKIERIYLTSNPITKISEPAYRHCYTWMMWLLGFSFFESCGSETWGNQILWIDENLTEIPFSLYLEKLDMLLHRLMSKLDQFPGWFYRQIEIDFDELKHRSISVFGEILGALLCRVLQITHICCLVPLVIFWVLFKSSLLLAHWLFNRCYVLGIIPAATWIREQLGYGRMISLR